MSKPSTPIDRIRAKVAHVAHYHDIKPGDLAYVDHRNSCPGSDGHDRPCLAWTLASDLLTLAEALQEISERAYQWEDYDIEHEASHALAKVGGSEK